MKLAFVILLPIAGTCVQAFGTFSIASDLIQRDWGTVTDFAHGAVHNNAGQLNIEAGGLFEYLQSQSAG